jgi:hypothetical protein
MSAFVVLALLGVIWGFVRQAQLFLAARAAHPSSAAPAGVPAIAGLRLPPGERIVSVSTDAGKLVMHVQTPGGSYVDIIDLATGNLTGQIRTSPQPASK